MTPGQDLDRSVAIDAVADSRFDERLAAYRDHVLARIEGTAVGKEPFYHLYTENVFPDELYAAIHTHMLRAKHGDSVQVRSQDNPEFKNRRFNLVGNDDDVVRYVRGIFTDPAVKQAVLSKFYISPGDELIDAIQIHEEFEYVFTAAHRFQNIHVDIPAKLVSFVFYVPEDSVDPADELPNSTVLYDKAMRPHHSAHYKANSVCVFAPHFHSYHGFSTTIPRDSLVLFYIHPSELEAWKTMQREGLDRPPFDGMLDAIESKLCRYPMLEIGSDEARIRAERRACRINAPQGRVLSEEELKAAEEREAARKKKTKPKVQRLLAKLGIGRSRA